MATLDPLPIPANDEEKKSETSSVKHQDSEGGTDAAEYPEGGLQAWLVIFGSFLALFSTWGIINSYGVFHDYYATVLLPNSSSSTISLIGALQLFFLYGSSPVIGRIFDLYGPNILLPLGSLITVVSLMLVSLCQANETYQFFLTHGLLFGFGVTLIFTPVVAAAGHWFHRRRPFAIGVMVSGSSLGGVIYPIVLQRLIPTVGFPWAVRVIAFINLGCLIVSCATVKTRFRSKPGQNWREGLVDLSGFRDPAFCLACVATFILFYAQFVPYFYIEAYANYRHVTSAISKYIVAIMNAAGVARILPSLLAVQYGALNVMIPATLLSGILVLALWLPSHGAIPLTIFSALYGVFSGVLLALLPAYIGAISPTERFGGRLGCVYFFAAVASLAGTPTAGAFVQNRQDPGYTSLILFTGLMILGGAIILVVARFLHSRSLVYKI
ncbi:monocarboxylate permease [Dendrothele bispora CBS 962.96]|uniref:Monocarboxylate permease n=1 Tax=Dendrothele bispora (strain CBS 962.96) TaxID=1314807 RepID=A0A4S8M1J0_DENBC|nr:monocarboxylate permease [Dendrothele bispora CBS 962.96]